jgi:hypothetical protein
MEIQIVCIQLKLAKIPSIFGLQMLMKVQFGRLKFFK